MHRIDLEQIAEALRLLHSAWRHRDYKVRLPAEQEESEARSLLHAVLDRHGLELQDFQPPALTEQRRARLVAELESGFGELPA